MKIGFVYDAVYPWVKGGAEKRIYELAIRLARKGHDVHIFGVKWWDGEDIIEHDGLTLHGVCRPIPLYVDGKRSIKEALVFSWGLLRHMKGKDFSIYDVSSFPYFSCFSAKIISIKQHTSMVITWHEFWGDYWYKYLGRLGFFGKVIEILVVKSNRKIISVSDMTKQKLVRNGAKHIFVIPNGIDIEKINLIEPISETPVSDVIFVGRLIEDKHVDVLLKAIQIVSTKLPDIQCIITGDGPEYGMLVELSKSLEIQKNMKFTGFLNEDDVTRYMKASKMMVLPSTREGFGMVVVEAFACGLPVIGVNDKDNAVSELIDNNINGCMVPLSAEGMADRIIEMMDNTQLRTMMSSNAIDTAAKYTWDALTDEIEHVYEKLSVK
ncbi:MAG: glycosyltransferase family 4 protein [Methanosarcinales archaeon]|nr:glycosyltransferase family 4 protein [Methanosarcinales archaeon]